MRFFTSPAEGRYSLRAQPGKDRLSYPADGDSRTSSSEGASGDAGERRAAGLLLRRRSAPEIAAFAGFLGRPAESGTYCGNRAAGFRRPCRWIPASSVWLSLAHFAGKPSERSRATFSHLVNTLPGLGAARPWFTRSEVLRRATRPEIRSSSQSLLSQLALQLCLRLAKVDRFLVCVHCQKPYSPVVRAPKFGQRNFCPECRRAGIPKIYALKDFRQRQRQSREGK